MKSLWKELKAWFVSKMILLFMETEQGKEFMATVAKRSNQISDNKDSITRLLSKIGDVEDRMDNVERLYDVGIDVSIPDYGESWAVLCIKGKPEYVRFARLKHKDLMELKRFLDRMPRRAGRVYDLPHGIPPEMFINP